MDDNYRVGAPNAPWQQEGFDKGKDDPGDREPEGSLRQIPGLTDRNFI